VSLPKVGFIGLGNMGWPMASRLAGAGYPLTVLDADAAVCAGFVQSNSGVTAAGGPDAFGDVELLILMLPNSAIVEEVLETDAVADSLAGGCLVVDMSSSEPLRTQSLATRLVAKGLRMLDAPVSGGVRGARAGTLSVLVGGDDNDLDFARPLLDAMAARVIHVAGTGTGHAAKALNNLVSAATISITVEAIATGEAFGIAPAVMTQVLNISSGRSNTSENKVMQFMTSGTFDSGFSLQLMSKDVGIATTLAGALDQPAEIANEIARQWRRIASQVTPTTDHTQMYALLGKPVVERAP
jgi:3-hydroxyisobutyrate dehydrogenase